MNKVAHKAFSVGYRIHRKQRSKNVGFSLRFVGYIAPITDALKPNKTNAHCPYIKNSESVVDFGRHYLVFLNNARQQARRRTSISRGCSCSGCSCSLQFQFGRSTVYPDHFNPSAKIKRRIERMENVHFHSCTFCPRIPLRRFKFLFFCIFSVPTQRNADEIRQLWS